MKAISRIAVLSALITCVASMALADNTLAVGSPAPEMKVAKWLKGKPVKSFEKGKVYVVEFWATWCGPCKQSIPHLTELAKKYAGKATFTGVSVFEVQKPVDDSYIAKVDSFVKEWGAKMDYNVAADGHEGTMGKTWMTAAGQNGIPTAFVVDQSGKVAWIGHPMMGLDEVVGQVIEGKFDAKAAADKAAKERAESEKSMQKLAPIISLMNAKKFPEAVEAMDKAMAGDPEMEKQLAMAKFNALCQFDGDKASSYAKTLADGMYSGQAVALNSLAWTLVDDAAPVKGADVKIAVEIAEKCVAATKDSDPMMAYNLDTLAFCYFKDGQLDKAISIQEKALKSADATKDFDAKTRKEIAGRLDTFKQKKNGGG